MKRSFSFSTRSHRTGGPWTGFCVSARRTGACCLGWGFFRQPLAMGKGGPLARRSRRSAKVATFLAERRGYWTSSALVLRMRRL